MFSHVDGDLGSLFAATAGKIFEVSSPAAPDEAETEKWAGQTSGDWSSVQFGNASGSTFMIAVNGADHGIWHDGTDIQPLVGETVYDLAYDALTGAFSVGQTVTGGTSGATAEILGIAPTSATAGTLKLGAITGTFQDNEALTDPVTGAATSNIPSGTSTASTVTLTNIATNTLSHVWGFKERLFFVEKDTMSVWYLPVESIGGAASEIDLSSIFQLGGSVLFGANWSLDSGSGLDDKCVIVSDQGEVAVFTGTDPASASSWSLDGVYRIGPPISKHSWFKMGGDLMLVTSDGIFPVSQAIVRNYSEVIANAFTLPIEDVWQEEIAQRSSSDSAVVTYWPSRGMLIVTSPAKYVGKPSAFVANTRIRAWARYTGWDVQTAIVYEDQLYFGDADGMIYKAETGGSDEGVAYTGVLVSKFSDFGTPGQKMANLVGVTTRASVAVNMAVKLFSNYEVGTITAPSALPEPAGSATWGSGIWGTSVWGGDETRYGKQTWKAVGARGFALAPGVAMTSNSTAAPDVEITGIQVRYEEGSIL